MSDQDIKEFEAILKRALDPICRKLKATDQKLKKIMNDREVSELKKGMKETIEQVFERCTSTDFSSRDREEILRAMQEYADLQVKEERERIKELESYVNVKHAIDTINAKKKLIEELSEWKHQWKSTNPFMTTCKVQREKL